MLVKKILTLGFHLKQVCVTCSLKNGSHSINGSDDPGGPSAFA